MSKYTRTQPAISRTSDDGLSEDHWLRQLEKNLQKDAVQPVVQQSIYDQMYSIMNQKSKHPTVEAAVEDMKSRSGLTSYLDKVKKQAEQSESNDVGSTKVASDQNQVIDKRIPIVIKKCPAIQRTFENCIRDSRGNLPIPTIIEKVKSIHHGDVSEAKDWDEDKLMLLVSDLNLKEKSKNYSGENNESNLGGYDTDNNADIDPSNTDAFSGLNPAKI
jgi:uncharacterized membrane-anchored protein YjiN (DUF445 family)